MIILNKEEHLKIVFRRFLEKQIKETEYFIKLYLRISNECEKSRVAEEKIRTKGGVYGDD